MMRRMSEPFRMRHQTKHKARRIADTSDVIYRPIGISRKRCRFTRLWTLDSGLWTLCVSKDNLSAGLPEAKRFLGLRHEASFAVRDGQVELFDAFGPDADAMLRHHQAHPLIREATAGVLSKRRGLPTCFGIREQAEFGDDLKAVADADNGHVAFDRFLERLGQMMAQPIGVDATGSNVIAITEAAGKTDEVGFLHKVRPVDQLIEVQ